MLPHVTQINFRLFEKVLEGKDSKSHLMASPVADINWQAKLETVRERNRHMFNNRELISDIKFAVRDSTEASLKIFIPAHKYILATGSSVFFAMFYGEMAEDRECVELDDCDDESFRELLRYIYCDEVNLTESCILRVWYLAHKYDIPSLARRCVVFLKEHVDASNVLEVLPHVRMFEENDLEEACWEVVDFRAEEILKSDSFLEIDTAPNPSEETFLSKSRTRIRTNDTKMRKIGCICDFLLCTLNRPKWNRDREVLER